MHVRYNVWINIHSKVYYALRTYFRHRSISFALPRLYIEWGLYWMTNICRLHVCLHLRLRICSLGLFSPPLLAKFRTSVVTRPPRFSRTHFFHLYFLKYSLNNGTTSQLKDNEVWLDGTIEISCDWYMLSIEIMECVRVYCVGVSDIFNDALFPVENVDTTKSLFLYLPVIPSRQWNNYTRYLHGFTEVSLTNKPMDGGSKCLEVRTAAVRSTRSSPGNTCRNDERWIDSTRPLNRRSVFQCAPTHEHTRKGAGGAYVCELMCRTMCTHSRLVGHNNMAELESCLMCRWARKLRCRRVKRGWSNALIERFLWNGFTWQYSKSTRERKREFGCSGAHITVKLFGSCQKCDHNLVQNVCMSWTSV